MNQYFNLGRKDKILRGFPKWEKIDILSEKSKMPMFWSIEILKFCIFNHPQIEILQYALGQKLLIFVDFFNSDQL